MSKPKFHPKPVSLRFAPRNSRTYGLARNLRPGERIPFETGFEAMKVDPKWAWVLEYGGRVRVVLYACPGHGMLYFLRIVTGGKVPNAGIVLLLRKVIKDAQDRGCFAYCCYLETDREIEAKLLRIAGRAKSYFTKANGVWVFGRTEEAAGF